LPTIVALIRETPFNLTDPSFQLVMFKAVLTKPSLISQASWHDWLACPFCSQVKPTFACNASVIVQYFAFLNVAVLTLQLKWCVALAASVEFSLKFAAQ